MVTALPRSGEPMRSRRLASTPSRMKSCRAASCPGWPASQNESGWPGLREWRLSFVGTGSCLAPRKRYSKRGHRQPAGGSGSPRRRWCWTSPAASSRTCSSRGRWSAAAGSGCSADSGPSAAASSRQPWPCQLVTLDVDDLMQDMPDLYQVLRVLHDHVYVLVGAGDLVEERVGLAPLDARHRSVELCAAELLARRRPAVLAAGSVRR